MVPFIHITIINDHFVCEAYEEEWLISARALLVLISEVQGSLACCSPGGGKELDTT